MNEIKKIEIEEGAYVKDFFFYKNFTAVIFYKPGKMFSIISDGNTGQYSKKELLLSSENVGEAQEILTKAAKESILFS